MRRTTLRCSLSEVGGNSFPARERLFVFADDNGAQLRMAEAGDVVEAQLARFTGEVDRKILDVLRETMSTAFAFSWSPFLSSSDSVQWHRRARGCRNHHS